MLGPVSQRVAINRTMDIYRSSMANCVQVAINRSLQLIATLSETGPRTFKNHYLLIGLSKFAQTIAVRFLK